MARDTDLTTKPPQRPPDDPEWEDPRSSGEPFENDDARDTAMPPDSYDDYVRRASADELMGPEARRALSAPSLPKVDPPRDAMPTLPDGDLASELEAAIPTVGPLRRSRSGPHEIPLDLSDEVEPPEHTLPLPIPTPVHAILTPSAQATKRQDPVVVEPGQPEWHDEVTMPDSRAPTVRGKRGLPSSSDQPASSNVLDDALEFALDGTGDALDLVSARATPLAPRSDDPMVELRDRYAVGDFTGAMTIAEAVLADDPSNAEVLRYMESCRDILLQMYKARLGSLDRVPRVALPAEELRWLTLDHRSGFLLSCIDGTSTIEEILDVSGMPPLDTLRILYTLMQQQIIELTPER